MMYSDRCRNGLIWKLAIPLLHQHANHAQQRRNTYQANSIVLDSLDVTIYNIESARETEAASCEI